MASPYADHDPGDEDAADHLHRLMIRDPTAALCVIVEEAGLTMTLYGKPIGRDTLRVRAAATAAMRIRVQRFEQHDFSLSYALPPTPRRSLPW